MSVGKEGLCTASLLFCFIGILQNACASFEELSVNHPLFNIDVDNVTGAVFIGGENVIVRASKELKEVKRVSTGPVDDNPECLPPTVTSSCSSTRVPTNNKNKILVIDQERKNLITCGSVYFGACRVRKLDTLEASVVVDKRYVASSSPSPSIAFIAPGPQAGKKVLYVGSTWLKYRSLLGFHAAIGSRKLETGEYFDFVGKRFFEETLIEFSDQAKSKFIVRYIFGYTASTFSYFVQVQQTLDSYNGGSKKYHTTIGRVCHKDLYYASYVEMPLVCKSRDGEDYNIAQSAFLAKPGELLSTSLGSGGDALFVAFANSTEGSPNATRNSALCIFSIKDINQRFSDNIKSCFQGPPKTRGMPWAKQGKQTCKKDQVSIYCTDLHVHLSWLLVS